MSKLEISLALIASLALAACADDVATDNGAENNGVEDNAAANNTNANNTAANNTSANAAANNAAANNTSEGNNASVNNASEQPSRVAALAKGEPYSRLIIEVDAVAGLEPEAIEDHVESFLAGVVDKPDGIAFVRDQTIEGKGSEHLWTAEELEALMVETNTLELAPGEVKVHVVFIDGGYEKDTAELVTLGLSWGSKIAMFGDTLEGSCARPVLQGRLCEFTEAAILLHEFGHVLGLVDNGAPLTSDHRDEEHGKHCTNPDCLMYWEYEGTKIVDALRGRLSDGEESVFELDEACMQDLAAIE